MDSLHKEAFLSGLSNRLSYAANAMKATQADRYKLLDNSRDGWSLIGTAAHAAKENDVVGGATVEGLLHKARQGISNADTYLGAAARGEENSKGFFNRALTDNGDNYIHEGGDTYRRVKTPSLTAPIKKLTPMITGMWALDAGMKSMDGIRGKQRDSF